MKIPHSSLQKVQYFRNLFPPNCAAHKHWCQIIIWKLLVIAAPQLRLTHGCSYYFAKVIPKRISILYIRHTLYIYAISCICVPNGHTFTSYTSNLPHMYVIDASYVCQMYVIYTSCIPTTLSLCHINVTYTSHITLYHTPKLFIKDIKWYMTILHIWRITWRYTSVALQFIFGSRYHKEVQIIFMWHSIQRL